MAAIIKRNKGVALLWTLIISLVMLIISGTMVGYIIKDVQSSNRIEDSTKAYAAAKTGLDWGSLYLSKNPSADTTEVFDVGGAQVTVTINATKIESTGDYNGVRRKIIHNIINAGPTVTNLEANGYSFIPAKAIQGGFILKYDFWLTGTGSPYDIGLDGSTGDIVMNISTTGEVTIVAKNMTIGSPATAISSPFPNKLTASTDPYRYKAVIKYIKNISATLELYEADANLIYSFVGSRSINLVGRDFGQFTGPLITSPLNYHPQISPGPEGDGVYGEVGNLRIDNIQVQVQNAANKVEVNIPTYTLNITTNDIPAALSSIVGLKSSYGPYEKAQFTVVKTVDVVDNTNYIGKGYYFYGWDPANSSPGCPTGTNLINLEIIMDGNKTCRAIFYEKIALFRAALSSGDRYYWYGSEFANLSGWTKEGFAFWGLTAQAPGSLPIYRSYNAVTGRHYYSTWIPSGFAYEGHVYGFPGGTANAIPMYMGLFNFPHFYEQYIWTTNVAEYNSLPGICNAHSGVTYCWQQVGVNYYVPI